MRAEVLASEFRQVGILQRVLLRYTQSLIAQMSQTAVCNRLHSVEQQLCRWLLLSHDRLPSNELVMTQELIADMLGVRREAVSQQAGRLQSAGLDQLTIAAGLPSSTARVSKREHASATAWCVVKPSASRIDRLRLSSSSERTNRRTSAGLCAVAHRPIRRGGRKLFIKECVSALCWLLSCQRLVIVPALSRRWQSHWT